MRWLFLILGLICSSNIEAMTEYVLQPTKTFQDSHLNPIKAVYQKSTGSCWRIQFHEFGIAEQNGEKMQRMGRVEKKNEWSRSYQFFKKGVRLSKHKASFDMGSLFDSLKKFTVYNAQSRPIGKIKGSYFTRKAAQFYFYNESGEPFAVADLERDWSTLTIRDISGDTIYECEKHFHSRVRKITDWIPYVEAKSKKMNRYDWSIQYDESKEFDERFFWPFMAFIAEVWWAGQTE